jgi:dTDP-4-dehydrorhamnose 3,5-epimerase
MNIEFTPLSIEGAALITTPVFSDIRGSFEIFWEEGVLSSGGLSFKPVNANHSYNSRSGTLRAFHYQESPHGQTKLVSCVAGKVWDVMVDLRPNSLTRHQWAASELSAGDGRCHYIPKGCAHGFVTLEEHSTVAYLIEGEYVPEASTVFRWNDPTIGVPWPVADPILSDKDRGAPLLIP